MEGRMAVGENFTTSIRKTSAFERLKRENSNWTKKSATAKQYSQLGKAKKRGADMEGQGLGLKKELRKLSKQRESGGKVLVKKRKPRLQFRRKLI